MFLGFEGPTKGMTTIWSHFVILVVCKLVIFKPQIMLKGSGCMAVHQQQGVAPDCNMEIVELQILL